MPAKSSKAKNQDANTAVTAVWQWVCYGLWELALITLSVLLIGTLSYFFVNETADYSFTVYFLAAMLCLLPPAYIVDRKYARLEPEQKHGFAGVIMVLNGVVVFIATIVAVITAVVSSLSIVVDGDASAAKTITIISSLVVAVLGAMLFVRVINPESWRVFTRQFRYIVAIVAAATLVLAIAGPVRNLVITRDDRLIENNLMLIQNAIENYAYDNQELPEGLGSVNLAGEQNDKVRKLIDRGLVTYEANTKEPTAVSSPGETKATRYYYALCATYKYKRGDPENYGKNENYLYQAAHPAGKHCFDMHTTVYPK